MNVKKILGFLAIGGLLVLAAPAERAQAVSLASPGIAAAVQDDSSKLTTEVRWGHHHGWHRHRLAPPSRLAQALWLAAAPLASPALAPLVTPKVEQARNAGLFCFGAKLALLKARSPATTESPR